MSEKRAVVCRVASLVALLLAIPLYASVVPIAQYHLGENDPGAAAGILGADPTVASIGGPNLSRIGGPVYSGTTPLSTSTLSMSFDGNSSRYAAPSPASHLTDNFGIEAWVRADSTSGVTSVAYNGDSAFGGWGLYRFGASWAYLYGGVEIGPMAPLTLGAWTHLAVVRDAGVTTFYVDGVPFGAPSTAVPNTLVGGMAIGGNFRNASENFTGLIDEVRIFTFAPGQFVVSDLNLTAPYSASADLSVVVTASSPAPVTGTTATFTAMVTNAGPDSASDVVVTTTLGPGLSSSSGNTLTTNIAALAPGATQTIAIDAIVDCTLVDGSQVDVTATVSSATADPNGGNNGGAAHEFATNPAPVFSCPPAVTATLPPSQSSMAIAYAVPVATDNCAAPAVSCTPSSGALFSEGTTTVTCTATDSGMRTTSCSFPITVLSAAQAAGAIQNLIAQLPLDAAQQSALATTLASAQQSLAAGNVTAAIGKLNATTNKVNALVASGRLTQGQAQSVIDALNALILVLR